jgi:hypothetical protein
VSAAGGTDIAAGWGFSRTVSGEPAYLQKAPAAGLGCDVVVRDESLSFLKRVRNMGMICLGAASGCFTAGADAIPSDFTLVVDVESADSGVVQNVNIRIDAKGEGRYERYETGGVVRGDTNDMVTYSPDQIVETGEFRVSKDELVQVWKTIEKQRFFELTEDYRMAMGFSYAFIVVPAHGRRHQVLNLGRAVPEIQAVVEAIGGVLPAGVDVVYREGFLPQH